MKQQQPGTHFLPYIAFLMHYSTTWWQKKDLRAWLGLNNPTELHKLHTNVQNGLWLKIERNAHFTWNSSNHTLTFRPTLHFWCIILLHDGRKRILEFENNNFLKIFVVLVLLTHKINCLNSYNTKVNQKCTYVHSNAPKSPKMHQKIPKRDKLHYNYEIANNKMHKRDHNAKKWTKCTEVWKNCKFCMKPKSWNRSNHTLRECSGSFEDVSSNTVICFWGIPQEFRRKMIVLLDTSDKDPLHSHCYQVNDWQKNNFVNKRRLAFLYWKKMPSSF